MREAMEGARVENVESVREQHERAAARAVAEEYSVLIVRADEHLRTDSVFQRVKPSLEAF